MRKKLLRLLTSVFSLCAFSAMAQPGTGEVLFTGFNADGDDALSFLALVDIPANTEIWFTDNEWSGTAFNTGEGTIQWTHNAVVTAGTVIELDSIGSSTITATMGTATQSTGSLNLSGSNEVLYAYLGTATVPTVFLSAISNDGFGSNGEITSTGLAEDTSAIALTGDEDILEFTGARTGALQFLDYQTIVCNTANWTTQGGSGDQHQDGTEPDVPFNQNPFTILTAPTEGEVIFTAFNGDGVDGMAIVTLIDLPPNTDIWFTDNEWNGNSIASGLGHFIDSAEGSFKWSDTVMYPAGSVIIFDTYTSSGMNASSGTVTAGITPNEGISGGSEVIYMYLGAEFAPTVFLSAITNADFPGEGTIDSTGLVDSVTAFTIGGGTDIAEYSGPRLGESLFSDYLPLVYDLNNWDLQNGSGDQSNDGITPDMPFNTTAFDTGTADVNPPIAQNASPISSMYTAVAFNEMLDSNAAVDTNSYVFAPGIAIDSIIINDGNDSVFIAHAAYGNGVAYSLEIQGVTDTAGNVMDTASFDLVWNESIPDLVITEIIHSPNTVEMIEVFNNSGSSVQLGGLSFTDGTAGTFPVMMLEADSTILFSTDPASAASLMGGTYYSLSSGLSGSNDDLVIRNSAGVIVDSVDYFTSSPWPAEPSGPYANSIELIAAGLDNNVGTNWTVPTQFFTSANGDIYATPGIYPPPVAAVATVGLTQGRVSVSEDVTEVEIIASITNSTGVATSVDLELLNYGTGTEGADFTYTTTQSFSFLPNSSGSTDTITISITDDGDEENSEYFAFRLTNAVNGDINTSAAEFTVMVNDNDLQAPDASEEIKLVYVGSYEHAPGTGSTAEIVAHDSASQRLFITNFEFNTIDVVDFSDPNNLDSIGSIDLSAYGDLTSIASFNGVLAVSAANSTATDSGKVVFLDTNGALISEVTVGFLPDMITFNHAGDKVLTANEGQPNDAYTLDPEGSVSIIDLSGGVASVTNANVSHARFTAYDGQEAALRSAGVRITGPSGTTTSQDMEPEYIAISEDDQLAYVTCQENNAVAVIDIAGDSVMDVLPLGYKDHMLEENSLDGNNDFDNIEIANWPLRGLYMPDAIAQFEINGVTYLVTGNEGDGREYGSYEDVNRLGDSEIELDSAAFPYGDLLKANMGRINVFNTDGDTDNDGDFDELYTLGARSFSIWNPDSGLIYDSGNDFEVITSQHPQLSAIFNASNSNNTFKNRSDDKGPEPEGVMIAEVNGTPYAFIGLERIGGVMVYNVSNPAMPTFVDYVNSRDVSSYGGDNGPEGLIFIEAKDSPDGHAYVIVANEVSGTLAIYRVASVDVEEYVLNTSDSITSYSGFDIFEGGFSGMSLVPGEQDEFYVVGDRGPNAVGNNSVNNTGGDNIKVFPIPAYAPKIHVIKAQGDTLSILETMTIKRPDSTDASGLPNPVGFGGTGEIAWSDTAGTVIPADLWGIDSEGIIEGQNNDLWIADEYGASVWHIDLETGVVINRYWPFAAQANNLEIDTIFKYRRANRGFEGVTMTPNGKVYACIQSGMYNTNSTIGQNTRLLRILEIDPSTGATQMFGYELQEGIGGTTGIRVSDWKLGDLVAVNNSQFLVLEHAERGGVNSKKVFKFDISNATPITTEDFGGQTFEGLVDGAGAFAQGIQVVEKEEYFNLLANGWDLSLDKPEGLSIINDSTIAVVNDNDFAIDSPNEDGLIVSTGKQTKLYIYTLPSELASPLNFCEPLRIDVGGEEVFCDGDSVMLEVITGEDYTWFDGASNLSVSNEALWVTQSGQYYAVSNVPACESESRSVSITVNDLPQVVLAMDDTICAGDTFQLMATGPNAASFDAYDWSTAATTESVDLIAAGDYSVIVTDTNGCESLPMDTFSLSVEAVPAINLGADTSICVGESITFSAPAGLDVYAWSNSASLNSITVNAAGTYSVMASTAFGCEGADTVTLAIDTLPIVNLGADTSFCDGNSLTLAAASGLSGYAWSTSATAASINVTTGNTYTVTVTDANLCQGTDEVIVTVDSLPVVVIDNDTICSNETAMFSAPSGLYAFAWSNASVAQAIVVSTAGSYTVTVTNALGCSETETAELIVNAQPVPMITGNNVICANDTSFLDAGSFASYAWSNTSATQSIEATSGGVYGVTVTDLNNCSNSDTIEVTVNSLPNVFAGQDSEVCDGDQATLNAIGASSYTWSNGTANGGSFTPTATATYTVVGSDANGCENADSVVVNVIALPTVIAGADADLCEGESFTWNATGAFTYTWSNGIGNGSAFVPTASNTYTVIGTDANGCENTDDIALTVNALPTTDLGPNQTICNDQVITLDAGAGFDSYSWSTGESTQTVQVDTTEAGVISVTVTDANGCEGEASVTVLSFLCVGVADASNAQAINVYPNPASDLLNIDFGKAGDVVRYELTDLSGRVLEARYVNSTLEQIQVASLAGGVYTLRFMKANGEMISAKRVVISK